MSRAVMIVDDDQFVLNMMGSILEDGGYDTLLVRNPLDAIAVAQSASPDLIVLDLMMPALSGGTVYSLLQEYVETGHIPVVVVSASPKLESQCAKLGIRAFLPKPFTPDAFLTVVERTIEMRD
ncbi:MAG: response regulator [Herpetosiphon sp.]